MASQPPKNAVFLTGSLMRHVSKMSLTASIGLMAMFAVDLVDLAFIAMLGNDALAAAVGYAGTLLFFTNSINIGLSIAAGSLVARHLGSGDVEAARQYATSVTIIAALIGLAVPFIVLSQVDLILALMGADGEVLSLAVRYVSIVMPAMWAMGIAITGMAVLRAYGDARRSMFTTLFGGTVNAVLDPILIFGLSMGLDGAAVASVLARIAMLIAALWPAIRIHDGYKRPNVQNTLKDFKAIRQIAIPAVLTNVATPVGNAIVIREVAQFGTDAVAGLAIIARLMPVSFSVIFALSASIGPIIGQNFGAQHFDRVRQAFFAGIKFAALYVAAMAGLLYILRAPIAGLFSATGITQDLVFLFCGPLALLYFFNGVIFVENASFNNLGRPMYSTWINWGRHTLGTWPLAALGGYYAGAQGVLWGQAIGGVAFAFIGYVLAQRVMSGLSVLAKPQEFSGHRRLLTVFSRRDW